MPEENVTYIRLDGSFVDKKFLRYLPLSDYLIPDNPLRLEKEIKDSEEGESNNENNCN